MIITVDGLDGSGKSTLAKGLCNHFGYEYIDKPLHNLFNVKGDNNYLYNELCYLQKLIYDKTDSNILKSYFTGLSLLYIKECQANKNLIIDRGLLSAYAFNGDATSRQVFEAQLNLGLFFDGSIFLTVSNEERIKRIRNRNANDPDLSSDLIKNLRYDHVRQFIIEHPELPCCVINTDYLSQEQVLITAISYIHNLLEQQEERQKTLIKKNY